MSENKEPIIIEQHQDIKKGANATQIANQCNYYGISYKDAKELCSDLIKSELDIYKREAEEIAKHRDDSLLNNFFSRLSEERITNDTIIGELKNPDMQFSYVEAQKSYIRLGTKELEDTLAELLVDRIKEKNRTLLQIALGEAITVVPMLLSEQLDILSICFRLKYTKTLSINNLETFFNYIRTSILPHINGEQKKQSLYQHLVYAKTGSIDMGEFLLEDIFSRNYSGLFMKGFSFEDIKEYIEKYPTLFINSLQNPSKLQINALDSEILSNSLLSLNVSPEDEQAIKNHYTQNIMPLNEIKDNIIRNVSESELLFNVWNESQLKNFTLTSVGIVLGANRSKQISGDIFNMNIWI